MSAVDILRLISLPIWMTIAAFMAPGALRVLRGKPRSLDPLWMASLLLALNRISFQVNSIWAPGRWLLLWCFVTSIAAALAWFVIARGYQRHDR